MVNVGVPLTVCYQNLLHTKFCIIIMPLLIFSMTIVVSFYDSKAAKWYGCMNKSKGCVDATLLLSVD